VPSDLAGHRCIGYSYATSGDEWQFFDADNKQHAVRVNCHMHTNNGDTARVAAVAGHGVIWQPTFLIGDDLRHGRLVALLPDYRLHETDVLAMYPSHRHLSSRVRVMIDFLVDALGGVPPWDRE
jgi:DNA-binding transcriptional LysR family regulator